MTLVTYSFPISDKASVGGEAEMESWHMVIGKWLIVLSGGDLIVRAKGVGDAEPLLKVKA